MAVLPESPARGGGGVTPICPVVKTATAVNSQNWGFNSQLTLGMPELQVMVGVTTTVGGVSAQHGYVRHGPACPQQPGLACAYQPLRRVYYGLLVVDK